MRSQLKGLLYFIAGAMPLIMCRIEEIKLTDSEFFWENWFIVIAGFSLVAYGLYKMGE